MTAVRGLLDHAVTACVVAVFDLIARVLNWEPAPWNRDPR